jgi:hypothetical protein
MLPEQARLSSVYNYKFLAFLLLPLPPASLTHVTFLGLSVLIISDGSPHFIEAPSYVIVSPVVQILLLATCS